jgi:phage terminase small subunit
MAMGSKKSGCSGLAFLALLVALLALWVGWSAYRRTGGTLDTLVKSPFGDATETTASDLPAEAEEEDWRAALEKARKELLRRRDDVANDRDLAAVQRDLTEIRQNLERAWQTAGDKAGKARDTWRELDGDLERLQGQVREKSRKAQETLDALAKKLESAG